MRMTDRAYRRDTRRYPKWKELRLAKFEYKERMVAKVDENYKKVAK